MDHQTMAKKGLQSFCLDQGTPPPEPLLEVRNLAPWTNFLRPNLSCGELPPCYLAAALALLKTSRRAKAPWGPDSTVDLVGGSEEAYTGQVRKKQSQQTLQEGHHGVGNIQAFQMGSCPLLPSPPRLPPESSVDPLCSIASGLCTPTVLSQLD